MATGGPVAHTVVRAYARRGYGGVQIRVAVGRVRYAVDAAGRVARGAARRIQLVAARLQRWQSGRVHVG